MAKNSLLKWAIKLLINKISQVCFSIMCFHICKNYLLIPSLSTQKVYGTTFTRTVLNVIYILSQRLNILTQLPDVCRFSIVSICITDNTRVISKVVPGIKFHVQTSAISTEQITIGRNPTIRWRWITIRIATKYYVLSYKWTAIWCCQFFYLRRICM